MWKRINISYRRKTCFEFDFGRKAVGLKSQKPAFGFSPNLPYFPVSKPRRSSSSSPSPPAKHLSLFVIPSPSPSLSSAFLLFSSPLFVSPLFSSPVLSSPRPSVYPIWQSHLSWELSQGTRLLMQFLLNLMALASAFAIRATCGKTKARRGKKKRKKKSGGGGGWVGGGGGGRRVQSSLNNLSKESVPGWLKQTDKPHFKTSRLFCSLRALVSWTLEIRADGQAAFLPPTNSRHVSSLAAIKRDPSPGLTWVFEHWLLAISEIKSNFDKCDLTATKCPHKNGVILIC